MRKKIFEISAALVALLGIFSLASVEFSNGGEMLLRVWGFISFVLIDIYVIMQALRKPPKSRPPFFIP